MRFAHVFLIAILTSPAFAQAVTGGQAPAVDWWARGAAVVAILISLAAFSAGRWDKYREAKRAAAAKLPAVDLHVENGDIAGNWYFQVRTTNRADVSIEFVSIDVGANFELRSDDAATRDRSSKIKIDRPKIEPEDNDTVDGDIHGRTVGPQPIKFLLEYRIFDAVPRTVFIPVKRDL